MLTYSFNFSLGAYSNSFQVKGTHFREDSRVKYEEDHMHSHSLQWATFMFWG